MYIDVESLHYTTKTNTILYVSYITIKNKDLQLCENGLGRSESGSRETIWEAVE